MPRRPSQTGLTREEDNLVPYSVRKLLGLLSERHSKKSKLQLIVNQMNVVDSDILDKVPNHQEQFIDDLSARLAASVVLEGLEAAPALSCPLRRRGLGGSWEAVGECDVSCVPR